MRPIHNLRCKFDEPYRIRWGFGLSPIRTKRELKALITFCKEQLKEEHIQKYNPKKRWVFEVTIAMYEHKVVSDILFNKDFNPDGYDYYDIHSFIDDNVGHYWS